MKLGIRDFDSFVKDSLKEQLLERYKSLEILTEADLQAYAFLSLLEYFRSRGSAGTRFKVLNKPYFKEVHTYPDIAVFKREKPWALFELKERLHLPPRIAQKERKKLLTARRTLALSPKRAYFLYAIPRAGKKVLEGPKGEGARYFFEVPIVLADVWPSEAIETWERRRKRWAKYRSEQPTAEVG
jgi:hypothetical protein